MLIDYRAFFRDWESIEVALVMIALITLAKFLAAYFTQKTFRLSNDQRTVIFGLSSAHVAATLAAVMVGYNVILGHTADGEPIRLLSESVLNGTILMILATCTVSTFATQRGAHNIAMRNAQDDDKEPQEEDHILIPLANEQTAYELVCLSMTLKKAKERNGLYALNAIDNKVEDPNLEKQGRKLLDMAAQAAASADNYMQQLLRYDVNIANAIVSVVKERNISDIVMVLLPPRTTAHHRQAAPGHRARKSRERGRVPALDAEITQPGREFECQDRLLRPGQHDAIPAAFARKTLVESRIRGFRLLG